MRCRGQAARPGAASRSTPGSATSRTCGLATGCMCSAAHPKALRASPPGSRSTPRRQRRLPRASPPAARPSSLGLIGALAGRFVPPGPAGAPARGRLDVLPTGRNLFAVDPALGPDPQRLGNRPPRRRGVVARYAQDHGQWPQRIVLDLWGSATMRTGGDDLAQAFALLGCRPTWDHVVEPRRAASKSCRWRCSGGRGSTSPCASRASSATCSRPDRAFRRRRPRRRRPRRKRRRTIRLPARATPRRRGCSARRPAPMASASGAASPRATGAIAPSLRKPISPRPATPMTARARDARRRGIPRPGRRRGRLRACRKTCRGRTRSTPTRFAEHEGGFAAAAESLGATPALYHLDSTVPGRDEVRVRSPQEIARALRGRAANPRWLAGQMRHGHRGAAEIAQSLDNLYTFAALTDAVAKRAIRSSCSTRRSATMRCARFWSTPISRPRATWRACSRRRRGAASGAPGATRRRACWRRCEARRHERRSRRGAKAGALAPCSPMETGDGLLVRVRRLRRTPVARPGGGDRGERARLRQRRDRPFGARQPSNPRRQRADPAGPASAPHAAGLSTRTPRSSACATSSSSPLSDIDPAAAFDLAPAVAALEGHLAEDGRSRPLPGEVQLRPRRRRPAAGQPRSTRTSASRRRRDRTAPSSPSFSAATRALAARRSRPRWPTSQRRLAALFSALRETGGQAEPPRMRAFVARAGANSRVRRSGPRGRPRRRSKRSASLRRVLGAHAYGAGSRRRRGGAVRRHRRGPFQR